MNFQRILMELQVILMGVLREQNAVCMSTNLKITGHFDEISRFYMVLYGVK